MRDCVYSGFWGIKSGEALYQLAEFLAWNKNDWVRFEEWLTVLERTEGKPAKKSRQRVQMRLNQLIRHGAVEEKTVGRQRLVRLTNDGWRSSRARALKKVTAPARKGLCLVIFDIPEKRRRERDLFRRLLKKGGFKPHQKSVFVHEKDVVKLVTAIVSELEIDDWVSVAEGSLCHNR